MDYITTGEAGIRWNISKRRVQILCEQKRILGTQKIGNLWLIPKNAEKPQDFRCKSPAEDFGKNKGFETPKRLRPSKEIRGEDQFPPSSVRRQLEEATRKLATETANREKAEHRLDLFFQQTLTGFFFMMLDEPVEWNDSIDKEKTLDYIFAHQKVTQINAAMLKQYGLTETEMIHKTPADFFAHDLKQGRATWRQMLDEGFLHVETDERRSDGSQMFVEGDYIVMHDAAGKVIGHFGVQEDVTVKKQTQNELKNTNTLLKSSLESPKDMIILAIDRNYRYYYFNQAHKEAMKYAYGQEVEVGMSLMEAITSETDKVNSKRNYDLAMQGVSHSTIQEYGDVAISFYESYYNPIYDEKGKIIGATAFARNISDRVNIQKKMTESEEKFRLLYASMSQGLALHEIITDDAGKPVDYLYLDVNESYTRLFGLRREDFLGKRVTEVMGKVEPYWIEMFGKVALTRQPVQYENYFEAAGRYFSTYSYSPQPRQFAVLVTDVTEQKKQQSELQEAKERFEVLFKTTPDAAIITRLSDGKILDVNERFISLFGYSRQELMEKSQPEINLYREPGVRETIVRGLEERNSVKNTEVLFQKKDQSVFFGLLSADAFSYHGITQVSTNIRDITSHKLMENALRESNQKYIAIFDKSPIAIEFYDEFGHLVHANEACLQLFGVVDRQDLSGFRLFDNPNLTPGIKTRIANRERIHVEFEFDFGKVKQFHLYETSCTGTKNLSISITPLLDKDALVGYVLQTEDITDQKRAETALIQSQDLLRYIIDHNNGGVAVHDKDMKYLYVSEQYLSQYGLKGQDIIGKNHYDVFPDLPLKWREVHQLALQGIVSKADDDPYYHDDGSVDWTRWECRPWFEADHRIGGIIVYTEVINERKRLELELLKEKETLKATLRSIGDGVIATDASGHVTSINMVAEKLTGWTEKEAQGKPFETIFRIISEGTGSPCENPVGKVILSQNTIEMANHTILISKHGSRHYIEDCASPIKNSRGEVTGVVLVFRDVTEKKQKQREIEFLSIHDYLTGLYNRRFYVEAFDQFVAAGQYPLGVMMLDVNGLKIINDAYGHGIGDVALKVVTSVLNETFGKKDIIARIGGDEFAVLLPQTTLETMQRYKDLLKLNVAKKPVMNITMSLAIGYEAKMDASQSLDEMLKLAENHMYRHKLAEGVSVRNRAIQAILNTLTEKYALEKTHSERVSKYASEIGKALNLRQDDLKELAMAGLFHDIGKISIPDVILEKPGKLTAAEFEIIKTHTEIGYQILRAADEYSDLAIHALSHHERWDGLGYPKGLKGEEIPLFSRIIGVVDAFEAMTADRPYKKTMTIPAAQKELKRCSGSQFDPDIVKTFLEAVLHQPHD